MEYARVDETGDRLHLDYTPLRAGMVSFGVVLDGVRPE